MTYAFTDAAALSQARNGEREHPLTAAAFEYLEMRLDGYTRLEANRELNSYERARTEEPI